jgi:probable phosphoglycerate mutase
MNRIYFVRHGEGQDNVARQFSHKKVDRPLTERGRLQARQTAEYLAGRQIDKVFCSPMKRAHETAQIIARRLEQEITILEEFREVNVGDLDGRDFSDETWGMYHDITHEWYAGNSDLSYPGGEDYVTLWARTRTGLQKILEDHSNCSFVLVGHGGIFIATLKEFCRGLEVGWLQNVEYYNCAITELEVEIVNGELEGRIVDWANYHHMSGDAATRASAIPPLTSIKRV